MSFRRYRCKNVWIIALLLILNSCGSEKDSDLDPGTYSTTPVFEVVSPKSDPRPVIGDSLLIEVKVNDWSKIEGDISIKMDGEEILTLTNGNESIRKLIPLAATNVGKHTVLTSCKRRSGQRYLINKTVTVLSDRKPGYIEPELAKLYPHSTNAFTQGLTFWGNRLLEGTGLNGKSSIREVDLATGNVIRQKKLDDDYFGEGITMHKGKLYQITWKSRLGFIYDPETFEELGRFSYGTRTNEGWGLTSDGEHLIISDGSETLYFLDSNYAIVKRLYATDNVEVIGSLNELEYYEGHIWANVYGTDIIVQIEAATGKVINKYDLELLRGEFNPTFEMGVLNGIAIDPNGNIFATGKNWPNMLELKIPEGGIQ